MRNLKVYHGNCFQVHLDAITNKRDSEIKERLISVNQLVKNRYEVYSNSFERSEVEKIPVDNSFLDVKDQLNSLYNYKSAVIRKVRENIQKHQIKTITNTCQNCTINSINTLDHILPKSKFPEYSVNPMNLFPCCSECNSFKNNIVENQDGERFLNLYLDKLPSEQYLFVEITFDSQNDINFNFFLKNIENRIPSQLFSIIEFHYNKLNLLRRFKYRAIEYVCELENEISRFKSSLSLDEIASITKKSIESNQMAFGINHWKYVLELSLINNEVFLSKFR